MWSGTPRPNICGPHPEEIAAGRKRIRELYEQRAGGFDGEDVLSSAPVEEEALAAAAGAAASSANVVSVDCGPTRADRETADLLDRSRRLLDRMHGDDREEAVTLNETIEAAIESGDSSALRTASEALREQLFFVEGQAG